VISIAPALADPTAEPKPAEAKTPAKPMVKKLGDGNYQIGKITFNKDKRTITIPATTHITGQHTFLEYLLCHFNGEKIHESLLLSHADPFNLNIALKLLNYKVSPELFRIDKPDGTPSDKYPVVAEEIRKAARFGIDVTWEDKGVKKTRPVTHWLEHNATKKHMPDTPWVYNGSYIHQNRFKAKLTGNMLSIFSDVGAIANYSGDDRTDDTIWVPAAKVPREGTKVTVTIKPWTAKP